MKLLFTRRRYRVLLLKVDSMEGVSWNLVITEKLFLLVETWDLSQI